MPRPQYPSDERRRKQRPHVKVHLSWPTHPTYGSAYANRDLRAIVLGVWMVAARAHASATGDTVALGPDQVGEITACRRPDVALTWLRRAADVMGWSLERRGNVTLIGVRNFSKKQGFDSAGGGAPTRTPHPSEEPKNRRTKEPSKTKSRPAPRASPVAISPPPESLSPSDQASLIDWALAHGYTAVAVARATATVLDWARSNGKKKRDWPATIRNGMRAGWALAAASPDGKHLTFDEAKEERLKAWARGESDDDRDETRNHPTPVRSLPDGGNGRSVRTLRTGHRRSGPTRLGPGDFEVD